MIDARTSLLLVNKPFRVLTQFSPSGDKQTLQSIINAPGFYPAGRLDYDSEGLLLLTDLPALQTRLADPTWKTPKTYFAQLEGDLDERALAVLRAGIELNDGMTRPAEAERVDEPAWLWMRDPPIRFRKAIPTSWLRLTIREGRNRQVRRMGAAVGFPVLRLIRWSVGSWDLGSMQPGESKSVDPAEVADFMRQRS